MTTVALEIERKYDVDPDLALPDLSGLPGVSAVAAPEPVPLEAVYLDTADLRLRTAGATLRHRTGGADAGWHLKTPLGSDRQEVRVAGDDPEAPVPEALAGLVRARVRTRELAPVAVLRTARTVVRLLGSRGEVLVELADDVVTGQPVGGDELSWREWEAELVDGDRELLDAVEAVLLGAGARRSGSVSKVARVLAARPPAPDAAEPAWWAQHAPTSPRATAGGVVQEHLRVQVDELVRRDPDVRRDLPDAVHKMRVATRRLRSAFATFRPVLERERTNPLRAELRWLAEVLGEARDAEVLHARLRRLLADEPEPDGPVAERVDTVLDARYRAAHEAAVATLDGTRYLALLDALEALVADPPFTDRARGRADRVLPHVVRRTWHRLDRAMRAAEALDAGEEQDRLLHEARKQAKQVRYAAEAVTPVFGRPAKQFARGVTGLQEALGEHQDSVVLREALREVAREAHEAGESTFTYGRLHALEQARAEGPAAPWPRARRASSRRRLRRWLA